MNILNLLSKETLFSNTEMVAIKERVRPFGIGSKVSVILEVHPAKIRSFRRVVLPQMEAMGVQTEQLQVDGMWQVSCHVDKARWRAVNVPTRTTVFDKREVKIYCEHLPFFETVDLYIEIARAPRKFFKEVVRPVFQGLGIVFDNPTNHGCQCGGNQARWRLTGRVPADRWTEVSCSLQQVASSLHPKLIRHWNASSEAMAV